MCDATQVTQALADLEDADESAPKEKVWARLITMNPVRPTIDLVGEQFILGRQSCCHVQFKDMNVSGKHCRIFKEPCKNGSDIVFLEDLSTNGTFINGDKVGKGNRLLLSNGAQIALVLNKKKPQETIAYMYQECSEDKSFEEGGPQKIYDIREALGAGNFAVVKLAINKATGERYAIKIIDKKKCFAQSASRKDAIMGEVVILQGLEHPNIINIKDVFDTEKSLYLVLELVECGDLFADIVKEVKYSEEKARTVLLQILQAVLYLHTRGIAHRDLKPENILLKNNDPIVIKLSDFGLSRSIGDGSFMKTMCGTPQYLAPEIITSGGIDGYGKEVDMWSVGAILYVLLCGYCPFEDGKSVSIFDQIKRGLVDFPESDWAAISYGAKDLIKKLLTVTPAQRYTAQQSINHPWVKGEEMKEPEPEPEAEADTKAVAATETEQTRANSEPEVTLKAKQQQPTTPKSTTAVTKSKLPTPPLTPDNPHSTSTSSTPEKTQSNSTVSATSLSPASPAPSPLLISKSTTDKTADKRKRATSDTDEDEEATPPKLHKSGENLKGGGGSKIQQQHSGGDSKTIKKSSSSSSSSNSSFVKTEEEASDDDGSSTDEDDGAKKKKKADSAIPKSGSALSKSGSALKKPASIIQDGSDDENNGNALKKSNSKVSTAAPAAKTKKLPPCKYGKACYRKNPAHLSEFSHPK